MKHAFSPTLPLLLLALVWSAALRADNQFEIDDSLYAMYERAHRLRASEQCLAIADSMLAEAKRIGDEKAECIALTIPMRFYRNRGTLENFNACCDRLRERARETGYMQYYYYAYQTQNSVLINKDKMYEAEQLLGKMEAEAIADQDFFGLAICYNAMGNLYYYRRAFLIALNRYDESIRLYKEKTTQPYAGVCSMASIASIKARDYERALRYIEEGLSLKSLEPAAKLTLLERKGQALFFLGRDKEYKQVSREYMELREKEGANNSFNVEFFSILDPIVDGQYAEAVKNIKRLGPERVNPLLYHLTLKEIYERTDDYRSALAEMDSMYELRVRHFNMILDDRYSGMSAELDNGRLEVEKARAETENARMEVDRVRRNRLYTTVIISITALFTIVALAIFLAQRIRSTRKLLAQNRLLEEAKTHAEEARSHAEEARSHAEQAQQRAEQAQQRAEEAQLRAEHSEQMKTIFVQNMSHEIRTPLNAIVGFAQLLAEPDIAATFSDKEKHEYSRLIGGNADMLMTLVNDILNISDLESGKYKMNYADCSCNEICHFCLKNIELRVPAGVNMRFTTEVSDDFSLHTDPQRVQQVITNFLTNACKHTSQGEILLHVSLSENPGNVTFSVTDTGTGVPADQAEAIFERFTKLDSFKQGTGLGLAICRMIADILHGDVHLDTTYTAGGARFVFVHPLTQELA